MTHLRAAAVLAAALLATAAVAGAQPPPVLLDPASLPRYERPLVIPPAMPRAARLVRRGGKNIEYYDIAVRQFRQQILPDGYPPTTVWSYGAVGFPETFHYPAFTIEARWRAPVRVRWRNELVVDPEDCFHTGGGPPRAGSCAYLPHLLPVDQTLHWANPPRDCATGGPRTDCRGVDPAPYGGPVPIVVHLHGAETTEDSDGFPEAWYLPDASDLPADHAPAGAFYETFRAASPLGDEWAPGSAVFEYANDQAAATLWYHDHALGITRLNVYAGPAGFYLLRGGPGDEVIGTLPGPAPRHTDPPARRYYEIPVAIQDRTFTSDGALFYPDNRAFFEALAPAQLQIPFIPELALDGRPSDVSPIWNPEFFGNTIVVNGRTWPFLDVEPRRYRLRYLNGSQSRFLILRLVTATDPDDPDTWTPLPGAFWQIGAEQGFLPAPVQLDELLLAPAERADVIMDFGTIPVPAGAGLYLVNVAPDEPFGGGMPGIDFAPADPRTTGQVLQFRPVALQERDDSTPPARLQLPAPRALGGAAVTRRLTLNEEDSRTVFVVTDDDGAIVEVQQDTPDAAPFGPVEALLGILAADSTAVPLPWAAPLSERPAPGSTEIWELYNLTADAHPIHIHLVQFRVLDRQRLARDADDDMPEQPVVVLPGTARLPEPWESGDKDTVIAYPGEVTRVQAQFPLPGLFVWHCHLLEHEDNEMMRPYCVGDSPACRQHDAGAE